MPVVSGTCGGAVPYSGLVCEGWQVDTVAEGAGAPVSMGGVGGVKFFVPGKPSPQGSKRHVGNGRMIESSREVGPWRERVALVAHNAMEGRPVVSGAVSVSVRFVMPRPQSARGDVPAVKRPDLDKLVRAVFDALTNVVFKDDSQVVSVFASKRLAGPGDTVGVTVEVL